MTQAIDPRGAEHASLTVGSAELEVVSLRGEESLSRLFRFEIVCAGDAGGDGADALLDRPARLVLRDGWGSERAVQGIVAEARVGVFDDGHATITLVIRPAFHRLTLGRGCRVYHDLDVVGIAREILGRVRAPADYRLVGRYPARAYTAQYREDDWSFLARLLEQEGIYFWFDHGEAQSTLVLSDESVAAPEIAGGAAIPFAPETGMHAPHEVMVELATEVALTPTKFTVKSFDPERPALEVRASVGEGPLEIYEARGGGPESPERCAARARVLREAAACERSGVHGAATTVRIVPGMVFEVTGHPLARLDRRYLATAARYQIAQRRRFGGAEGQVAYECRFRAIPQATPFRPPAVTAEPKQAGLQTGVVAGPPGDEIFPDGSGRVRVQHHWDREGKRDARAGKWMRVAQRGTAESMLLPRIGWTVLTFNEEGTLDAPSVLSRIHDGEHLPTYSLPGNRSRVVFRTATTPGGGSANEIYFEDKDGAEEMFINASRDMNVLALNAKKDDVKNDATRKVGVDHTLSVAKGYFETVKLNQSVTIGASETIKTGGLYSKVVGGNETITIGGARTVKTGANHGIKVTKNRKVAVGAAIVDVSLGPISASAQKNHSLLVGGAVVRVSNGTIAEQAKVAAQTIGGAKLELAKTRRVVDVGKIYLETVGGVMILKTDKKFVDTGDVKLTYRVGGSLAADAPDVLVQAKDRIEIKCGGSVITVLPDSVEIKATNFDLSGASLLEAATQKVEHN